VRDCLSARLGAADAARVAAMAADIDALDAAGVRDLMAAVA
jgi:hypothetical protein